LVRFFSILPLLLLFCETSISSSSFFLLVLLVLHNPEAPTQYNKTKTKTKTNLSLPTKVTPNSRVCVESVFFSLFLFVSFNHFTELRQREEKEKEHD